MHRTIAQSENKNGKNGHFASEIDNERTFNEHTLTGEILPGESSA